jgi:hypothetical protein
VPKEHAEIEDDADHHKNQDAHLDCFEPIRVFLRLITTLAQPGDYLVAGRSMSMWRWQTVRRANITPELRERFEFFW